MIAVIGGAGKSGKFLVRELIRQGFTSRQKNRNPLSGFCKRRCLS